MWEAAQLLSERKTKGLSATVGGGGGGWRAEEAGQKQACGSVM